MQVKIYADVVFFINFFMDFFILWIVSRLVKNRVSFWRLVAGSLLASVLYCTLLFFPLLHRYYNFFGALFILAVSLKAAFRPKGIRELLKLLFFAHVSAFAVGGAGIAIFYFTNISSFMGNMLHLSVGNFSFKVLLAATAFIYIALKLGTGWINVNITNKKKFCDATIYYDGIDITVTALMDTGSSLYDPLTKKPVLVAEFTAIKEFFPPEVKILFYKERVEKGTNLLEELCKTGFYQKIRMIPFSSLGAQNGMLFGFQADKADFYIDGRKDKTVEEIMIGIYNNELSTNKGYHALINTDIFEV